MELNNGYEVYEERLGILDTFDSTNEDNRQQTNGCEKENEANQYSEYRVEHFGNLHFAPSLLCCAIMRIAISRLPPSFAARRCTSTFSVSSVV